MLLDTYKENELIWQNNVLGEASPGVVAFRGDLAIELGDMHESSQTRNPPKQVLEQVALLAESDKITFLSGYIADIASLEALIERFKPDFAEGVTVVLYCFNIDKELKVEADGVTYVVQKMDSGLVWNELLDLFYLEKSDLKGQSAEEKVATVAGAKGELKSKGEVVDLAGALAASNGEVREFGGPV